MSNDTDKKVEGFRAKLGRTKLGLVIGIVYLAISGHVTGDDLLSVAIVVAAYMIGQGLVDFQKERNKVLGALLLPLALLTPLQALTEPEIVRDQVVPHLEAEGVLEGSGVELWDGTPLTDLAGYRVHRGPTHDVCNFGGENSD